MVEKRSYAGWDNCYRLSNGLVEMIITGDVGPRIIRFGFIGMKNMFKEYADQIGRTTSNEWLNFGGHRLWHAPEVQPRTYFPDLEPVLFQELDNSVLITQKPEPTTGIQKQIEIRLATNKPEAELIHRLINHNLWAIEAAPWAISVMAPGGVAILPLPPRGTHPKFLQPTATLSIWPYTDFSDPRWVFGKEFILLRQDSTAEQPQKIGIFTSDGWAAYANYGVLFVKQSPIQYAGIYPDLGANFEVFTNKDMLELESLGPLQSIPPKGVIDHQEHWTLVKDFPTPETEADIFKHLLPT